MSFLLRYAPSCLMLTKISNQRSQSQLTGLGLPAWSRLWGVGAVARACLTTALSLCTVLASSEAKAQEAMPAVITAEVIEADDLQQPFPLTPRPRPANLLAPAV